jgi:hypothetical protein
MRKLTPMSVLVFLVTVASVYGRAKYGYGFFGGK